MEEVRIARVFRSGDSVQHYHRLYAILKSVLPEYVGELESLERTSPRTGLDTFAVFLDDFVVGGYVLEPLGQFECHLSFMGLTQGVQKRGLGNLMAEHMKERARDGGMERIRAETQKVNVPKFRRMGFKEYFPRDKGSVAIYLDVA
jgi:GNAT superfamily N-acetyltransferase